MDRGRPAPRCQLSGFADGTYRPAEHVTREQMASFIARAMGLAPLPGEGHRTSTNRSYLLMSDCRIVRVGLEIASLLQPPHSEESGTGRNVERGDPEHDGGSECLVCSQTNHDQKRCEHSLGDTYATGDRY